VEGQPLVVDVMKYRWLLVAVDAQLWTWVQRDAVLRLWMVLAAGLLWNGKVEDAVVERARRCGVVDRCGDVVVVDLGVDEVVERGSSCCGLD
jgi:hypothetical protein